MNTTRLLICLSGALFAISARADDKWDINKLDMTKLPPASEQGNVTFAKDIKPIFEASCVRCHGKRKQKGELRLDTLQAVLDGGKAGKIVVPGASKSSLLVAAIAQVNPDVAMPPKHHGHHAPSQGAGPESGSPPPGGNPPGDTAATPDGQPKPKAPREKPLTPAQVGLVRAWIDQGAR